MSARVLLIDDDEGIARLLTTLLTRAGFEVLRADDGRGGLRKLGWNADESPIEAVRGFGYRYRKTIPS